MRLTACVPRGTDSSGAKLTAGANGVLTARAGVPSTHGPTAYVTWVRWKWPRADWARTLAVAPSRWLDRSRSHLGVSRIVEHGGRPRAGKGRTEAEGFKLRVGTRWRSTRRMGSMRHVRAGNATATKAGTDTEERLDPPGRGRLPDRTKAGIDTEERLDSPGRGRLPDRGRHSKSRAGWGRILERLYTRLKGRIYFGKYKSRCTKSLAGQVEFPRSVVFVFVALFVCPVSLLVRFLMFLTCFRYVVH